MQRILITGGAGFIGSHLAKELVKEGHEVICYDYRTDWAALNDIKDDIQSVQGDVRDLEKVRRTVLSVDGIIHLAAVSRVIWGYENPRECVDINVDGTANILEASRMSVIKPWVIFGSSREVYGEPAVLPCTEDAPKVVHNVYGATKISCEMLCEQYHKNYGINVGILRFSNVYGSQFDQLDRVIPKFILRAARGQYLMIQGGNQLFDFTHVDDTVKGIMLMMEKIGQSSSYFDDFHILTQVPTSLQDLAKMVLEVVGSGSAIKFSEARQYDVEKFYGSIEKSAKLLGYKPEVGLLDGVKRTAKLLVK